MSERNRVSKSIPAVPKHEEYTFKTSKADKRRIKHATLVSRIEKSNAKPQKRRRPSKKLITTLESLADALPDAPTDENGDALVDGVRIMHRSLKSRPGAMKRKEKIEQMERDRFTKNMAQMANIRAGTRVETNSEATSSDSVPEMRTNTTQKWTALRGFITSTLK